MIKLADGRIVLLFYNARQANTFGPRNPIWITVGRENLAARQPVKFGEPVKFMEVKDAPPLGSTYLQIASYSSLVEHNGKLLLFYNDCKHWVLFKCVPSNCWLQLPSNRHTKATPSVTPMKHLLPVATLLLAPLVASHAADTATTVKPNIILILADDLGYRDAVAIAQRRSRHKKWPLGTTAKDRPWIAGIACRSWLAGRVKIAAASVPPISQQTWDEGRVSNWHQGSGIVVTAPEVTEFTQLLGNYIENAAQGIDIHADHVIISQNIVNNAFIGMKAMHGSRNVIITGNQFTRNDLWAIGLMPGAASHPAQAGKPETDNSDGGSIIANNIISDFGHGHAHGSGATSTRPSSSMPARIPTTRRSPT